MMLSAMQGVLGLASGALVGFSLGLVGGGGSILAVPLMVYAAVCVAGLLLIPSQAAPYPGLSARLAPLAILYLATCAATLSPQSCASPSRSSAISHFVRGV